MTYYFLWELGGYANETTRETIYVLLYRRDIGVRCVFGRSHVRTELGGLCERDRRSFAG